MSAEFGKASSPVSPTRLRFLRNSRASVPFITDQPTLARHPLPYLQHAYGATLFLPMYLALSLHDRLDAFYAANVNVWTQEAIQ